MGFATFAGHDQCEHQVDANAVGRVEIDRCIEPDERTERAVGCLEPAVRDGDALAKTRGPQPFPGDQFIEYISGVEVSVRGSEQFAGVLQCTLFAGGLVPGAGRCRANDGA